MLTLSERKDRIREALDHDQITELRRAVGARKADLEKLKKKESDLGVDPVETRRLIRVIDGDETTPGLLALIAPEPAYEDSEQIDVLHEKGGTLADCSHENTEIRGDDTVCVDCERIVPRIGGPDDEEADDEEADDEEIQEAEWEEDDRPAPGDVVEVGGREFAVAEVSDGGAVGICRPDEFHDGKPFLVRGIVRESDLVKGESGWRVSPFEVIWSGKYEPELRKMYGSGRGEADTGEEQESEPEEVGEEELETRVPEVGDRMKSFYDLRRTYTVSHVEDGRMEVEDTSGEPMHPLIDLAFVHWDQDRECWIDRRMDIRLRPGEEVGPDEEEEREAEAETGEPLEGDDVEAEAGTKEEEADEPITTEQVNAQEGDRLLVYGERPLELGKSRDDLPVDNGDESWAKRWDVHYADAEISPVVAWVADSDLVYSLEDEGWTVSPDDLHWRIERHARAGAE